jgi:hypothetical protein
MLRELEKGSLPLYFSLQGVVMTVGAFDLHFYSLPEVG